MSPHLLFDLLADPHQHERIFDAIQVGPGVGSSKLECAIMQGAAACPREGAPCWDEGGTASLLLKTGVSPLRRSPHAAAPAGQLCWRGRL